VKVREGAHSGIPDGVAGLSSPAKRPKKTCRAPGVGRRRTAVALASNACMDGGRNRTQWGREDGKEKIIGRCWKGKDHMPALYPHASPWPNLEAKGKTH
jgi:hypothetical protein